MLSNNNETDLAVVVDGRWQKRVYQSLNGIISVSSFDTGKILDVQILTKYCQKCKTIKPKIHICSSNYTGTSGAMECEGAIKIFHQSLETIHCVKYLGDGAKYT